MTAATGPRNDRGETSVQTTLLVPVILSIVFAVVQAAALSHGGQVASLAANRGAQLAASSEGTSGSLVHVRQEIERTVTDLGNSLESPPQFSTYRGNVTVTVRIAVPHVVPLFSDVVTRTASAPLEHFIEEQSRR
jgi:Flp pilus assembly protein TadG